MILETVWLGKFPKYWDVTPWAVLLNEYLVCCYRNEASNRRVIEVQDLRSHEKRIKATIYNGILGCLHDTVYFAKISDARSHLQISRIGSFNINEMAFNWECEELFLIEKYKIPQINDYSKEKYILGNKQIELSTGHVNEYKFSANYTWPIGEGVLLVQDKRSLECIGQSGNKMWSQEGCFGKHFQGAMGDHLVFFTEEKLVFILNKWTGQQLEVIQVPENHTITNRIYGDFTIRNDISYDNSTIADLLMNASKCIWINDNLVICLNRATGKRDAFSCPQSKATLLSDMKRDYFLMYSLLEEDYGSLIVGKLEE